VYGDFNCPYSCLASARVDVLVERKLAEVEWRAIEHAVEIPVPSEPAEGDLLTMLEREVSEVLGLVRPGERFSMQRPLIHPNTAAAVAAFAGAGEDDADRLRRVLFAALWSEGRDIGDAVVLDHLVEGGVHDGQGRERADRWREEWMRLDRRLVPMLVLPDGYVSRGLGALARLADLSG
jgi:predicted DsbA family dithiol-disulfide isomerase